MWAKIKAEILGESDSEDDDDDDEGDDDDSDDDAEGAPGQPQSTKTTQVRSISSHCCGFIHDGLHTFLKGEGDRLVSVDLVMPPVALFMSRGI